MFASSIFRFSTKEGAAACANAALTLFSALGLRPAGVYELDFQPNEKGEEVVNITVATVSHRVLGEVHVVEGPVIDKQIAKDSNIGKPANDTVQGEPASPSTNS